MELSYVTSGESHGPGITAVVSGLPAGLALDREAIRADLARRQAGYGRSPRQRIEQDDIEILGGVRHGLTLGGPLALIVRNRDHANWGAAMSAWPVSEEELAEVAARRSRKVQLPRPGHADLSGVMKYDLDDVRNVLERASARETAARVAVGAITKGLLALLGIGVFGRVLAVGSVAAEPDAGDEAAFLRARSSEIGCSDPAAEKRMLAAIDAAADDRDTLGGIIEIRAFGSPPGLGSHTEPRLRLDARLAAAAVSIQAMKGVEIGDAFDNARLRGSAVHDDREEGIDHLALAGEIGIGAGAAPCTRRRARLASCRAAVGERPTIGAISSKGTANMSCSTKASRSAGASVSSTTSSARPTESASSASCSGSVPSPRPDDRRRARARPAAPRAATCATAACPGTPARRPSSASRPGSRHRSCRRG